MRRILFPLVPEYIGYVDQTFESDSFVSDRPLIHKIGQHEFKYGIDFDMLRIADDIAGIAVSRPTNPSGNVITNDELEHLSRLAVENDIPLIVDNAYGMPFPGVITDSAKLVWNDHIVLSMSLSKVGLPSSRTGIFVGPPDLMRALTSANAIVALANPGIGQLLTEPLLVNDEMLRLSRDYIQPFYADRAKKAKDLIEEHFPADLPWRLHTYEGSYFYWLWLEGLKGGSKQLYSRLKERGVIVVPGDYFFPGQNVSDWPHAGECIRLNFARPDVELEQGIPILAEEISRVYAE